MTARLFIAERVVRGSVAFADRSEAGRLLASVVVTVPDPGALVLALPRGGVPVGAALSDALGCELGLAHVRKLPLPSSAEMGFGAVALDGTVSLNETVMAAFGVSRAEASAIAEEVRHEVERRAAAFAPEGSEPDMRGRTVYLADDGLATGYSTIAAAGMARAAGAGRVVVAVPVAPEGAVRSVSEHCDELYCLIEQASVPFAVASFYERFGDLSDDEVRSILHARRGAARVPPR